MRIAASGPGADAVAKAGTIEGGLPDTCVLYAFDAYCGWCWGISPLVMEPAAARASHVPVVVLSGGLFIGERAQRIDAYPHIPAANRRIANLTGTVFGAEYGALLADGSFVLDSHGAAAVFAALRAQAPQRAMQFAHRLQEAFYVHGLGLSDVETAVDIARDEGLDAERVRHDLERGAAHQQALHDFELVRELHVQSHPTLLGLCAGRVTPLPGTGTPVAALLAAVDDWMAGEGEA